MTKKQSVQRIPETEYKGTFRKPKLTKKRQGWALQKALLSLFLSQTLAALLRFSLVGTIINQLGQMFAGPPI